MPRRASIHLFVLITCWTLATGVRGQFSTAYTYDGSTGDNLGAAVAGVGDINQDGLADFMVGAPRHDGVGTDSGQVRVFSGADGSVIYTFDGLAAGDRFGHSVAGAGDVNQDGIPDLVVGAPFHDSGGPNSGRVQVFSGADGSLLYTFDGDSTNDQMGTDVAAAGDVNQDGFGDIIVGMPDDDNNGVRSGAARVFSGIDGSTLFTFDGDQANDNLGYSVGGAGDTNGDGCDDLVVGIWGEDNNGTNAGAARIYSGFDGSILHHIDGDSTGDQLGRSVSGAGDVNRDGFGDVILGAPQDDNTGSNSGSARVVSGLDGSTLHVFNGTSASDLFGEDVNGAGDVDGDGFADLIVGMPFEDTATAFNVGAVVVYSGRDGSLITQTNGTTTSQLLGNASAGAGDINGDGFDDILVGSEFSDDAGTDAGRAFVYTSPTLPVFSYSFFQGGAQLLNLDWYPDMNDPFSPTGTMVISGATPGGLGELGVSLAPANLLLFGYLHLFIAIDPMNVVADQFFGYDAMGELTLPGLSRQIPFLAGNHLYIQAFELSPIVSSSNGLSSLIIP